jgi:hypothetical protein
MLGVGLEQKILSASQLVLHVTPEVLAHHLPPDVMTRVLAAALAAGQRGEQTTPERLFETLGPDVLVDNVPLEVLWRCIDAGAERAGIAGDRAGEGQRL